MTNPGSPGVTIPTIRTESIAARPSSPVASACSAVKETNAHGDTSYDLPGTVLVAIGLGSLVYGFTKAEHGWLETQTLLFIGIGLVALVAFVLVEKRSTNPLLPLSVPWHRHRGAELIGSALVGSALLGGTLYLILAAAGLFLLTQTEVDTSYWTHVFPGLAIFGFGLGLLMVPMQNLALLGVPNHDAGAASALANATLQVGGALGTALFTTVYASAKDAFQADNPAPTPPPGFPAEAIPTDLANATPLTPEQIAAMPAPAQDFVGKVMDWVFGTEVSGYAHAFGWAGALIRVISPLVMVLVRARKGDLPTEGAVGMH